MTVDLLIEESSWRTCVILVTALRTVSTHWADYCIVHGLVRAIETRWACQTGTGVVVWGVGCNRALFLCTGSFQGEMT